jgi:hypothetical protein
MVCDNSKWCDGGIAAVHRRKIILLSIAATLKFETQAFTDTHIRITFHSKRLIAGKDNAIRKRIRANIHSFI